MYFFVGSGLGDLHFFGVAMLLLFLHKLHMLLTVRKKPEICCLALVLGIRRLAKNYVGDCPLTVALTQFKRRKCPLNCTDLINDLFAKR